jgi:hypothetical protein
MVRMRSLFIEDTYIFSGSFTISLRPLLMDGTEKISSQDQYVDAYVRGISTGRLKKPDFSQPGCWISGRWDST